MSVFDEIKIIIIFIIIIIIIIASYLAMELTCALVIYRIHWQVSQVSTIIT